MGNRYFLTIKCSVCNKVYENVYYAPTCGFTEHICKCSNIIDLVQYSNISYKDASNKNVIEKLIKKG